MLDTGEEEGEQGEQGPWFLEVSEGNQGAVHGPDFAPCQQTHSLYLLYFPLTVCTKGESRGAWLSPELKAGTGVY